MHSFEIIKNGPIFLSNCGATCELSAFGFGRVLGFLRLNNFPISQNIAKADYVLINSCCVISGKRNEVRENLRAALQQHNVRKIVMFGCFAGIGEFNPDKIIYITSKNIETFDNYFEWKVSIKDIYISSYDPSFFMPYQSSFDPGVKYILISQGCENSCSYCNIKLAKGATKSRQISEILRDIDINLEKNSFEFILLADDCGSYGADINTDIIQLISRIFEMDSRIKIRIHYLFPKILIKYREQFEQFVKTGRITYINFPIQSGSQRVLNLMNRRYDIDMVLKIIKQLKILSPGTWFYTHIIVNFPTETDEDFICSLKASEFFDELLFMNYSKNPLTSASKYPEVEKEKKMRRLSIVQNFLDKNGKGLLIDDVSGGPRRY